MRFNSYCIGTFLLLAAMTSPALAFRCGPDGRYIAAEGMHKYQVLNDCGAPVSRETVGTADADGATRLVEEWLYIVQPYADREMYLLRFDGRGMLRKIDYLGRQRE